jgi:hypothetical protein
MSESRVDVLGLAPNEEPSPPVLAAEKLFEISDGLRDWHDKALQICMTDFGDFNPFPSENITAANILGLGRFQQLVTFLCGLDKLKVENLPSVELTKRYARLLSTKSKDAISNFPKSLHKYSRNISHNKFFINILVFAIALQSHDFENVLDTPIRAIAATNIIDELLGFDYLNTSHAFQLLTKDTILSNIDTNNDLEFFLDCFESKDAFVKFYLRFVELRTSLIELPNDIAFIFDTLQTLVGTPKHRVIYAPAILGVAREVVTTRTLRHPAGEAILQDFGKPVVNDSTDTVTLAPDAFDEFKQGRSFEQFRRKLYPILQKW